MRRRAGFVIWPRLMFVMDRFIAEIREGGLPHDPYTVVISHGRTTLASLTASTLSDAERLRDEIIERFREIEWRYFWPSRHDSVRPANAP